MKYTAKQRKDIADAFAQARKRIESGTYPNICSALTSVANPRRAAWDARRLIHERMGGHSMDSLEAWLHIQWGVPYPGPVKMKAYRLAWLDSLIEEFSR